MKLHNWLKRKYPNHYKQIIEKFGEEATQRYLKEFKYKVGIMNRIEGENQIGDLCFFRRVKEYGEYYNGLYVVPTGWTGQFEYTYLYQKPASHWCTKTYVLNCDEIFGVKN